MLLFVIECLQPALAQPDKAHKPLTVAYIGISWDGYWGHVKNFMHQVADDLDIRLLFKSADNGKLAYKALEDVLSQEEQVDYLVFTLHPHSMSRMFALAESKGIPYFTFNRDLTDKQKQQLGKPREKYPLWLGHIYADDYIAGRQLAELMVKATNDNLGKVSMIGIGGTYTVGGGAERNSGLIDLSTEKPGFVLNRVIHTKWRVADAERAVAQLMTVYPDTNVIWSASESLTTGTISALRQLDITPGKEVLVGGIDWSPEGLESIQRGELHVSLGGSFMQGGWSLILLHDYHQGIDFNNDIGTMISLPLHPITAANIERYVTIFDEARFNFFNFKTYSKYYSSNLERYLLSPTILADDSNKIGSPQ